VIEPRLLLRDKRKLIFEPGPARRKIEPILASEIVAGGDSATPQLIDDEEESGPDTGIDFLYSDRDGQVVAVELKASRSRVSRVNVERAQKQVSGYLQSHSGIDRAEVWTLDEGGSQLTIWRDNDSQKFGLARIETSEDNGISDAKRRRRVDSEYVEVRVNAWKNNVQVLFAEIRDWCEVAGYVTDNVSSVSMNEELMQRFGVQPVELPILKIFRKKLAVATLLPVGLWVIGANGRIDLLTARDSASIVNTSDDPNFARWLFLAARKTSALTRQAFIDFVDRA
jgi:hypothetical protein